MARRVLELRMAARSSQKFVYKIVLGHPAVQLCPLLFPLQYSTLTLLHSRREHAPPPPWPPCCTALPSPLPPYSTAHSPYCTADESMLLHLLGHPVVQLFPLIFPLTVQHTHLIAQQTRACSSTSLATLLYSSALSSSS